MKRGPKINRGYDPAAKRWDRPAPTMWRYRRPIKVPMQVVAGGTGLVVLALVLMYLASGCWGEC